MYTVIYIIEGHIAIFDIITTYSYMFCDSLEWLYLMTFAARFI